MMEPCDLCGRPAHNPGGNPNAAVVCQHCQWEANPVVCTDCGRTIAPGEDFWFSDWKCPSEIYCDVCGPKHGYPHPTSSELDRLQ